MASSRSDVGPVSTLPFLDLRLLLEFLGHGVGAFVLAGQLDVLEREVAVALLGRGLAARGALSVGDVLGRRECGPTPRPGRFPALRASRRRWCGRRPSRRRPARPSRRRLPTARRTRRAVSRTSLPLVVVGHELQVGVFGLQLALADDRAGRRRRRFAERFLAQQDRIAGIARLVGGEVEQRVAAAGGDRVVEVGEAEFRVQLGQAFQRRGVDQLVAIDQANVARRRRVGHAVGRQAVDFVGAELPARAVAVGAQLAVFAQLVEPFGRDAELLERLFKLDELLFHRNLAIARPGQGLREDSRAASSMPSGPIELYVLVPESGSRRPQLAYCCRSRPLRISSGVGPPLLNSTRRRSQPNCRTLFSLISPVSRLIWYTATTLAWGSIDGQHRGSRGVAPESASPTRRRQTPATGSLVYADWAAAFQHHAAAAISPQPIHIDLVILVLPIVGASRPRGRERRSMLNLHSRYAAGPFKKKSTHPVAPPWVSRTAQSVHAQASARQAAASTAGRSLGNRSNRHNAADADTGENRQNRR